MLSVCAYAYNLSTDDVTKVFCQLLSSVLSDIEINDEPKFVESFAISTRPHTPTLKVSKMSFVPLPCMAHYEKQTEAGENQITYMNKVFLPVADADRQRQHHHSDFEHQRLLKVAWDKQDNHEVEMEKEERNCVSIDANRNSYFPSFDARTMCDTSREQLL